MSSYRTGTGGLIDRDRPINFEWEGHSYRGFSGDTLASALLANGVRMIGRSFKYHRPRGVIGAGLDEPNFIVQLEAGAQTIPNLKGTYVELYDGLSARPVNAWPNLKWDVLAVNGLVKRFIPAAFYYKTFMWPNWLAFEPAIRKAAGLGVAPDLPDPDLYAQRTAHTDLLIVGGGLAGLIEARRAAAAGRTIMLVTGGSYWGGRHAGGPDEIEGLPADRWIADAVRELSARPNVSLLNRTIATGHYDHGMVALCERISGHISVDQRSGPRERLWRVRAAEIILATGAIERPMVFSGNDRPGVMLADAALRFLRRFGVVTGRRIVVATATDSAWHAAFALADAGAAIVAILDLRNAPADDLVRHAAARGIRVLTGTVPVATTGRRSVTGLRIGRVDARGRNAQISETIACDTVLTSAGWNPAVHLHSQGGGKVRFDAQAQTFLPVTDGRWRSVGAAAGQFAMPGADPVAPAPAAPATWSISTSKEPPADGWVDFQNDVTAGDIALAARENFRSVEHLKRYTTLGMASDQGKTSNVSGIGILSGLIDKQPEEIGTTKFRPPYDPTTIGVFAGARVGEGLRPRKRLAMHGWHLTQGAALEEYGGWMRPSAYVRTGETEADAIAREVNAVRREAGIFDASPLGKIEVKGRDAALFLDRMFVNTISSLKTGRCRYTLMLTENGTVFDDGIVSRLADDHFLVGTTSGHAAAVAELFEEWLQCEWPDLHVVVEDVTPNWGVLNLAGPLARDILASLETDIDFSGSAFAHMTFRAGSLCGIPVRVSRVSFSGELSYEIAAPWRQLEALWVAVTGAGTQHGLTPFGVEALMTMRIEKGFLHVGADTDGTTLPQDIHFGRLLNAKKGDFVGRRSALRSDGLRTDRRSLVGIEPTDDVPLPIENGSHLVRKTTGDALVSEGWVTSSAWSPTLGKPVALAMIERGSEREGEIVRLWFGGVERGARIVAPCRYDPEGARQNA